MLIDMRIIKRFIAAVFLICAAALYVLIGTEVLSPGEVAGVLRIADVPASLRNAECKNGAITDVVVACAFEIDSADFPALLAGWDFKEAPEQGGSHAFSLGLLVGQNFPVVTRYSLSPLEFENGGYVSLVTNAERTRGLVFYYKE